MGTKIKLTLVGGASGRSDTVVTTVQNFFKIKEASKMTRVTHELFIISLFLPQRVPDVPSIQLHWHVAPLKFPKFTQFNGAHVAFKHRIGC